MYSFIKRSCYDSTGTIAREISYDNDKFSVIKTFIFDSEDKTGRIYFPIDWSDTAWLEDGDLLSYNREASTGKLSATSVEGPRRSETKHSVKSTLSLTQSNIDNKQTFQHMYLAQIAKPLQHLIELNYKRNEALGTRDIDVVLRNDLNTVGLSASLNVIDELYNVSVEVPDVGKYMEL